MDSEPLKFVAPPKEESLEYAGKARVNVSSSRVHKTVAFSFGGLTLTMNPTEARQLAGALRVQATKAEGGYGDTITRKERKRK